MMSWGKAKAVAVDASKTRAAEYATEEEFCAIFERDMKELYTLALMLTGNQVHAEKCFLAALDECRSAQVFRAWEKSWSRLAIIENAIRIVRPLAGAASVSVTDAKIELDRGLNARAAPVMRLDAFQRFVFVLSVLDRYSVRDCAVLLKCAWKDTARARRHALEVFAQTGHQVFTPSRPLLANNVSI